MTRQFIDELTQKMTSLTDEEIKQYQKNRDDQRKQAALSSEQWKVDILNQGEGEPKYFDCRICKNKGHVVELNADGFITYRTCECEKKRACFRAMERCGQGHEVKYMLWSDIARRLTALKYKEVEYNDFFLSIVNAEVLYIDDLFKTYRDPAIAFDVINARYTARENRPTIISTEMNLDAIHKIDEGIAGRIAERSKDFCYQIRQDLKRNYRYKKKSD